ncbi:MAG: FliM/FliN family flagellar motor switch protein [Alphaproteobacteria bacterium]|nr:FliM/FliN family flagellar motor switch protein [Alphaproteobacteria bacterium]
MAQENEENKTTVLQNVFDKEALMEVNVDLTVVLGRTLLRVYQLLKLGRGAVVELNRQVNEPVEILANEIPIAKGEVIVTDEGYIGVKITELLTSQKDAGGLLVGKVGSFGK